MAGSYADYPEQRLAYHLDGTQGAKIQNGVVTSLSAAELLNLNNESTDQISALGSGGGGTARIALLFPQPIDLDAVFIAGDPSNNDLSAATLQWSNDTTNGEDGTWTNITYTMGTTERQPVPDFRSDVRAAVATGITAIRVTRTGTNANIKVYAWHLFGLPSTLPSGQNLAIWHPVLDQPVGGAHFDWGDAARSALDEIDFRVKNLSASQQANSVTVGAIDSSDSSPSFTDAHYFDAGSGFGATASLGNLAAGTISGVVTCRLVRSATQQLSVWASIIEAEAGSWT